MAPPIGSRVSNCSWWRGLPRAPWRSTSQALDQPGHTTYDAALGVSKDAWRAQFYRQNITDTRGKVFISDSQAIETETVIRPRVLGVKFGYRF
jgi:hypothetical protein